MPCLLTVLEDQGGTYTALIVDISETGIALVASESVPPDTLVSLKYETSFIMGEVRNCRRSRNGFRIGVEIVGRD